MSYSVCGRRNNIIHYPQFCFELNELHHLWDFYGDEGSHLCIILLVREIESDHRALVVFSGEGSAVVSLGYLLVLSPIPQIA